MLVKSFYILSVGDVGPGPKPKILIDLQRILILVIELMIHDTDHHHCSALYMCACVHGMFTGDADHEFCFDRHCDNVQATQTVLRMKKQQDSTRLHHSACAVTLSLLAISVDVQIN